jgi:hypothetical protein
VAAVAQQHARAALDWWTRPRIRWLSAAAATLLAILAIVVGVLASVASNDFVAAVILVLVVAIVTVRPLKIRSLTMMEMANTLALPPVSDRYSVGAQDSAVAPGQEAGPGNRDLALRYDRGRVLRQLGILFVFGCLILAIAWLTPGAVERGFFVFLGVFLIGLTVLAAVRAQRWGLRRPILTLDADGMHMPRYGYTLPWAELTEVRLIPLRYPNRRGRQRPIVIVAFVPADSEAALRELRAKGAPRRFEKSRRLYGTPLTIADQLMDQTAGQIAAAASSFAPVPVRQY